MKLTADITLMIFNGSFVLTKYRTHEVN